MDPCTHPDPSPDAERTMRLIANLESVLDEQTLAAITDVWSLLEHAATDDAAHGRAVRSRLFWQTMRAGGSGSVEGGTVHELPLPLHADGELPAAEAA